MKYLSEALKINKSLTQLNLFDNNIGDKRRIDLNIINNKLKENKIYQENRQK